MGILVLPTPTQWEGTENTMSSEANRKMVRQNRQNLQHGKFWFDIRKDISTVRVAKNWNTCLEWFWNFHPWRYYKFNWTKSSETCSKQATFWSGCWTRWSPVIPSNLHHHIRLSYSKPDTSKRIALSRGCNCSSYKIQQKLMSRCYTIEKKWQKKSV